MPHRLSINGIYELPFGRERRFGGDASGALNALIGGWQVQGIYALQSGFPIGTSGTCSFPATSTTSPSTIRR